MNLDEHKKSRKAKRYPLKPRSPVAANSHITKNSAGPHRDKKKEDKKGHTKHKKHYESLAERLAAKLDEAIKINRMGQPEIQKNQDDRHGIYFDGKLMKTVWGREAAERVAHQAQSSRPGVKIEVKAIDPGYQEEAAKFPFAGAAVGHKEGPAGQWRNKGPSKNRPARVGDLVGSGESVQDRLSSRLSQKVQESLDDAGKFQYPPAREPKEIRPEIIAVKKQLAEVDVALQKARGITREIKYDRTAGDIVSNIHALITPTMGIDPREVKWAEEAVSEAQNALESAVYALDTLFAEKHRDLSNKLEELQLELEDALKPEDDE